VEKNYISTSLSHAIGFPI